MATRFHFKWESHLLQLQRELRNDQWIPGAYYSFRITDPKPRLISAAPFRDRIIHHAVVNVLEPVFERRFIFDSYACRRDKGTHKAIERAQYYLRRHKYFLKTDIVKFFPNVDHEHMYAGISHVVKDVETLRLVQRILDSGEGLLTHETEPHWFPGDDLLATLRPKGLPIGNLTSQFFANVLLDPVDHFIKETLRVPGYVRYADDLLLFGDSKQSLWEIRDHLAERMARIRLQLHPHKTVVSKSDRGVRFLGFRVFPDQKRLTQAAIRRFNVRRRNWQWQAEQGSLDLSDVSLSLQAWLAHLDHCNSKGIRRELLKRLRLHPRRRRSDPPAND